MKKKRKGKKTILLPTVLTVVLGLFIVTQGMPYFQTGDGASVSIGGYMAFPTDHPEITEYLAANIEGYNINSIVGSCVLLPLCAAALVFLVWRFRGNAVVSALTGAWGLWGLIAYAVSPALALGGSARILYIALFVVACAVSLGDVAAELWARHRQRQDDAGKLEKGLTA